jgi:hypothetical protein
VIIGRDRVCDHSSGLDHPEIKDIICGSVS